MAANPTGPAPITATTSPGLTPPYWTPISKPVGRMSESMTAWSSLTPSGILYSEFSHAEYVRVPYAENSLYKMPEDPADSGLSFVPQAIGIESGLAIGAVSAG